MSFGRLGRFLWIAPGLLFIAGLVVANRVALAPRERDPARVAKPLDATIEFRGTHFSITVREERDCEYALLELGTGERVQLRRLEPGREIEIATGQFRAPGGAAFDPDGPPPRSLRVGCDAPDGRVELRWDAASPTPKA